MAISSICLRCYPRWMSKALIIISLHQMYFLSVWLSIIITSLEGGQQIRHQSTYGTTNAISKPRTSLKLPLLR